jgi:serine-threonine kinase receptor-associated protein
MSSPTAATTTTTPAAAAAAAAPAEQLQNLSLASSGNGASSPKPGSDVTIVDGPIMCTGHSRPVPDVSFSNIVDERIYMVSGCLDGAAMLRDGETGDWIGTFQGHKGAVWCVRLNSTATQAVTASADFSARLWDAVTGDCLKTWEHKHVVKTAIFSRDDKTVVTGGQDATLRFFDITKTDAAPVVVDAGGAVTHSVALDNNLFAFCGRKQNVFIWDIREHKSVRTLETKGNTTNLSLSVDSSILTCTADKEVYFWDAATFELRKQHTLPNKLNCVSFDSALGTFVTGSPDELYVRVYNYEDASEVSCNKGHHGPVRCIQMSPSQKLYASGSEDGTVRLWEWPNHTAANTE